MLNRFHNRCVPSFSPGIAAQVEPVRLSPKEGVTYSLFYAMHSKMGVMVLQKIHFTSSSLVSCLLLTCVTASRATSHLLAHAIVPHDAPPPRSHRCPTRHTVPPPRSLHRPRASASLAPPPQRHASTSCTSLSHRARGQLPSAKRSVAASTASFLKHNGS
jgi:hypothetical protein